MPCARQPELQNRVQTIRAGTVDDDSMLGNPGGFGKVYLGFGPNGEPVAIKVLHSDVGNEGLRELEFARAFVGKPSQYVVRILDYGSDAASGHLCIVMVRAEQNLRQWLASRSGCDDDDVAHVLTDVTRGLLEAHDFVHRDLKPENILLLDGRWQVADFGIARLAEAPTATHTLRAFLSPPYAAPEQFDGRRATHETDVYSLGCVGFELLMGHPPFRGTDFEDFANRHRSEPPVLTKGSPWLRMLILSMLAKPQAARLSLEMLLDRLAHLASQPRSAGHGADLLAQASHAIAVERAREEAEDAAVAARGAERTKLRIHGQQSIRAVAETLFRLIEQHSPTAQVIRRGDDYSAQLGLGKLTMSPMYYADIAAGSFRQSGWDIICGGTMVVESQRYIRSASLWYGRTKNDDLRWREVSYWSLKGGHNEPCYLPPGEDADYAAAPIMHNWNLAHPPRPIDGDDVDAFCDRWMSFLAQAASGRLARPSNLPEP